MLDNKELLEIEGGAIKWTIGVILGAFASLLAGIIDGYLRPGKCN